MVEALEDPRRIEPSLVGAERGMLESWLEFHRVTLLLKCEGLSDQERKARPVDSSLMSLHGLVRHMTDVERNWFQWTLLGRTRRDLPPHYWSRAVPDGDFAPLEDAVWEQDLAAWESECEASREAARNVDLDYRGRTRQGEEVSLRWIYVHMIEEYARHNGHADLIRELIDGAVGD